VVSKPSTVVLSGNTQLNSPSAPLTNWAPAVASAKPNKNNLPFSSNSNALVSIVILLPTSVKVLSG